MALRGGLRMETVDVYTERGDLVTCSDCGKVMLLPYGADKCPACKKEGCLVWTDESLREADIDSLLERHCNLHQKSELQPEEYLSLSILVTEYIPYLADKPQTARETLFLLLETGSLFEKYWRDTRCFQSENIYTPAIKTLLDKLDVKLREGDTIPVEYRIAAPWRTSSGSLPASVRQRKRYRFLQIRRETIISTDARSRWKILTSTPTAC